MNHYVDERSGIMEYVTTQHFFKSDMESFLRTAIKSLIIIQYYYMNTALQLLFVPPLIA